MGSWNLDLIGEMERMRREVDRLLGDTRSSEWTFPFSRVSFLPGRAARAYPLINIGEDKDNFYIDALAPGVTPEDLNVSVLGTQVSITGEKKPLPEAVEPEEIHRSERSAARFVRTAVLPSEVQAERVNANYANGVLRITLPKAESAKPKQIEVKVV